MSMLCAGHLRYPKTCILVSLRCGSEFDGDTNCGGVPPHQLMVATLALVGLPMQFVVHWSRGVSAFEWFGARYICSPVRNAFVAWHGFFSLTTCGFACILSQIKIWCFVGSGARKLCSLSIDFCDCMASSLWCVLGTPFVSSYCLWRILKVYVSLTSCCRCVASASVIRVQTSRLLRHLLQSYYNFTNISFFEQ